MRHRHQWHRKRRINLDTESLHRRLRPNEIHFSTLGIPEEGIDRVYSHPRLHTCIIVLLIVLDESLVKS